MIKLIRDNVHETDSIELSGIEFKDAVLDNISCTVNVIKTRQQTEDIINDVSDILELINVYLSTENIKAHDVLEKANQLRNELGSYNKKLSIKSEIK